MFLILFAGYENTINPDHPIPVLLLLTEDIRPLRRPVPRWRESLRLLPPAPVAIRRFPIADITIAGRPIPAGSTVLLAAIASANRDPARRVPRSIHRGCVGRATQPASVPRPRHPLTRLRAPLSFRIEGPIAVTPLFQRIPTSGVGRPGQPT